TTGATAQEAVHEVGRDAELRAVAVGSGERELAGVTPIRHVGIALPVHAPWRDTTVPLRLSSSRHRQDLPPGRIVPADSAAAPRARAHSGWHPVCSLAHARTEQDGLEALARLARVDGRPRDDGP